MLLPMYQDQVIELVGYTLVCIKKYYVSISQERNSYSQNLYLGCITFFKTFFTSNISYSAATMFEFYCHCEMKKL